MKTKIIYISGNEVFEMSEIRAAFESVRATLGLDSDTILFGVPVDADDALTVPVVDTVVQDAIVPSAMESVPVSGLVEQSVPVAEEVCDTVPPVESEPETVANIVSEPQSPESEPVIPILSILSAQESADVPSYKGVGSESVAETITESDVVESANEIVTETAIISDIGIETELTSPIGNTDDVVESVSIGDMITDEAPVVPVEKTLEQLLESMTPLREDVQTVVPETDESMDVLDSDGTDATLAQLATEFADNQDKIPTTPRTTAQGKIGKLKNILPFKKAKRDDNGLMGDLFGWAGIAANDEDFSIPGFFTPATSKKQGA